MDTTKVLADPVTGESLLAGLEMAIFSLYPHTVRARIPSQGLHTDDIITSRSST